MAVVAAVACMFAFGQANAFTTGSSYLLDPATGANIGPNNSALLDKAARWDSKARSFGTVNNRSLVGGLGYNFEGGNLTTFMQQFTFEAGVDQSDFNAAVAASFNAWSSRDSFVTFTKASDPVVWDFDINDGNQAQGNEIDFFGVGTDPGIATPEASLGALGVTMIWGADKPVRLTNGYSPDGTGLFPSTSIFASDIAINYKYITPLGDLVPWKIEHWQATLTHELGHALGLGDVDNPLLHFFDDDVADPLLHNGLVVNDQMTINEAGDVRYLLSDWGQPCTEAKFGPACAGILMRSEFTGLLALAPDDVAGLHFLYPVPEPESYAMMLAGLGLLALVARRRKQNATAGA